MKPPPDDDEVDPLELLSPLDDGPGPARRISKQRASALVQAAMLAAAASATSEPGASAPSAPPAPKARPRWPFALVTGGAVLVAGAAATLWYLSSREEVAPPPPLEVPAPLPTTPVEPRPPLPAPVEVAPAPQAVPSAPTVEAPRRPAPSAPLAAKELEDLLSEANALRSKGSWKEAEALYQRVIRADEKSMAAYVAHVASGSLRLEHLGNARGALREFQAALKLQPRGVLSQEAAHGVAEAWRALGEVEAEAKALESFLATFPDSPLAVAAQTRLSEISR